MTVRFPHGNSKTVSELEFIGAWKALGELVAPSQWQWDQDPMPRSNRAKSLEFLLEKGLHFGLDALCRCLVDPGSRNTMHATNPFMAVNDHLLIHEQAVNPASQQSVNGARLSDRALEIWNAADECERDLAVREGREALQALVSDSPDETGAPPAASTSRAARDSAEPPNGTTLLSKALPGPIPVDIVDMVSHGLEPRERTLLPGVTVTDDCDPRILIRALVEWIARDTFQEIRGRNKLVGEPVSGWHDRLQRYFWDGRDYGETHDYLKPVAREAMELALALENAGSWSTTEAERAVHLADSIFDWGGRRPGDVTPDRIRSVFKNALADEIVCEEAPLGSGWSKVAAFATNHLEAAENRDPQAIWDSRVSTAITCRLDRMLVDAGTADVPLEFRDVGPADVGEGGTRPRELGLDWCNAYGKWRCQLAGSRFVRAMRDVLNDYSRPASTESYPAMPLPDGSTAQWTVRGVEMVLFMDGY